MQGAEKNILVRMDLEHMDALSPPESDCSNFLCSSKQCATKNAKSQVYEQKIFYFNLTWFESLRQTLPQWLANANIGDRSPLAQSCSCGPWS